MKKGIKVISLALPIAFAGSLFMISGNANADEINSSSLTNYTYNIKDNSNNDVTKSNLLDKYTDYTISRSFSISDNKVIKNGDYVYIGLPDNVNSTRNNSFPVKDNSGEVVGEFTAEDGQRVGKLTFTNANYNDLKNKSISIVESVKGTKDNSITDNSWTINKYGWVSHDDPNKIIWNINFNPANKNFKDVQLSDVISANQTFLGNVSATAGHVDTSNDNQFISNNQSVPVSVNNNNGHLHFTLNNGGAINQDVSLVYETQLNQSSNSNLIDANNNVTISAQSIDGNASDNINPNVINQSVGARILSGGYGIANGNQPNEDHKDTTNANNSGNNNPNNNQLTPAANNQQNNNSFTPVHETSNDAKTINNTPEQYATNQVKIPNQLSHQNNKLNIPIHNNVNDAITNNHKLPNDNKHINNSGNNKKHVVTKQLKQPKTFSYKKNIISHPTVKINNQQHEPNMFINNKTQKLPQTGDSNSNNLSLIGLLMLSVSSIFLAFFKHKY